MSKIIAALNMTLDGNCDHTAGIPDKEIHQHYTQLLGRGDAILYGRKTFELMEFWRTVLENPSEEKSMNDFAKAIDKIPKIVFSRTLSAVDCETATIAKRELREEVLELKKRSGNDIFVGSRSLITQLLKLHLIDEFQLCIYPIITSGGLSLFADIEQNIMFRLVNTKIFDSGSILMYYQPIRESQTI